MSVKWLEIAAGGGGGDLAADDGDDAKRGERVFPSALGSALVEEFPVKPLNLITIWGAARTGKSFFLNALARADGLFHVSGAMEPCTSGADLCRFVISGSDFARGDYAATATASGASVSRSSSVESPMVGFVDVEGQGDRHSSYDILLVTPLLLLSKASATVHLPTILIEVCHYNSFRGACWRMLATINHGYAVETSLARSLSLSLSSSQRRTQGSRFWGWSFFFNNGKISRNAFFLTAKFLYLSKTVQTFEIDRVSGVALSGVANRRQPNPMCAISLVRLFRDRGGVVVSIERDV